MLKRADIKIYSFDIFDTCIARLYEKPVDLFFHLGELVSPKDLSKEKKFVFAQEFSKNRIIAEHTANKSHGKKRSCHFDEIYEAIKIPSGCQLQPMEIKNIELGLEEKFTYPIKKTLDLIESYRSKGCKIIYISDMYLDKDFIKKLMTTHGFFKNGDEIFVSSETSLTKRSGELFKYILKVKEIKPNELLHHGDDLLADIKSPKRLGVKTHHLRDTHLYPSEKIFNSDIQNTAMSQQNALSKHLRLAIFPNAPPPQIQLINLITLFLVQYVLWVFFEAQRKGINKLYFMAKDSEITYKIAKDLNYLYPSLTVQYLYGSRRAWLQPSINVNDHIWKPLALSTGERSSLRDALERLNFSTDVIEKLVKHSNISKIDLETPMAMEESARLLDLIFNNKICQDLIKAEITQSSTLCLQYFSQEGLFDGSSWAIVDTGWALNAQAALRRILSKKVENINIKGFYIGMTDNHLSQKIAGEAFSFTGIGSIYSKRRLVIEHCFFASTHGSTITYINNSDKIKPSFAPIHKSNFDIQYTQFLHEYVKNYIKGLRKLEVSHNDLMASKILVINKVHEFLCRPNRSFLPWLSGISASPDSRHTLETQKPIFHPLRVSDLCRIVYLYKNKRQSEINNLWFEASVTSSNMLIRLIFKILYSFKKKVVINHVGEHKNRIE